MFFLIGFEGFKDLLCKKTPVTHFFPQVISFKFLSERTCLVSVALVSLFGQVV